MENILKLREIYEKMELNISEEYLDTVFLKNIVLNKKKKTLNIDLISELFIKKEIFELIEKTFKDGFPELKVFLNLIYRDFRNIDIDKYIEDLLKEIRKLSPSIGNEMVKLFFYKEEKRLEIKVNSKVVHDYISKTKIKDSIRDKISKEFCESIFVQLILEENISNEENHIENKNKEEKDLIEKHKQEVNTSNIKQKEKPTQFQNGGKPKYNKRRKNLIQPIEERISGIKGLNIDLGTVCIKGEVFHIEVRDLSNGTKLMTFSITDFKDSINCKIFLRDNFEEVSEVVKEKANLKVLGDITYDNYSRQNVIMVKGIEELKKIEGNMDTAENKRVELHTHTKMSSMDGIASVTDLISRAAKWGHKAIAITDHGVLQSFPEAMYAGSSNNIKIIYGVEGYLLNDREKVAIYRKNRSLNDVYVVFDIETTGFSSRNNKIIEIGAVKISEGKIIDNFSEFIDPEEKIPERITELTGIDNSMVEGKGKTKEILEKFLEFIEDSILVAHNASFDMSFIREKAKVELNIDIENDVLDTVSLSRSLFHDLKNHRLNTVAKYLNISLKNHHRAVDDAKATSEIFLKSLEILRNENVENLEELNNYCIENRNFKTGNTNHIIILAQNLIGLKNLYKLVSESHIENFYKKPRINKSSLEKYREGLILGSACEGGEVYRKILKNSTLKDIEETVDFYDFLEVQSLKNNDFLVRKGEVKGIDELIQINKQIIELGKKHNKLAVATGDVHFLNPKDEIYRRILMTGQGFSDGDNQAPLYFKTTDEMLSDFYYLSTEEAYKIVVENTNKIADMIEDIKPIPDGTYPPIIEGSDEDLRNMTYKKAKSIYGEELPEIVEARLERELNSIIKNGYAVMYIIAQKLVGKSLEDGYLVGSRGSVGSSFAATMSDITEVNPLAPHYICENCKYSEFITDGSYGSGIDLPDKNCPDCGNNLIKDGHSIPFEVFLGFEGDKEPDIDLNFAGEYQSVAHKYTEELFGEGKVFRAGTIGTIAEKTAYGFVKKYFDAKEEEISGPEINRLVKGCTGIKRTSGQHPGGIMVVPDYKDIYDFTPIQHPADDKESGVITTHFDYNAISGRILKLDILGHDVPSIIRMLEDLTGIKPEEIPLDDSETMKLFVGTESLEIEEAEIGSITGTLGIPEFGTKFVRQMLIETKPSTFEELVRISGLSHGTDVWINNAQELVKSNIAPLKEVICTRDDIMNYLILKGMDKKLSFKIMEKVRKGRAPSEEEIEDMIKNNVPSWYIESCQKIKYMFPKAHAVAYVMMSFRIAYFKVHKPLAFYATYFSTKINDFSIEIVSGGIEGIRKKIEEIEKLGNSKTAKEKNLNTVLEVALEMLLRGYEFKKVDIYKSLSHKFSIEDEKILPPLKSLEGVGDNLAKNIVVERELGEFISVENMINRTKATKSAVEVLKANGCLNNLQETNQIDLFSI